MQHAVGVYSAADLLNGMERTSHLIKFTPQTGGETCFYKKDTFIFMPHMHGAFGKALSRSGVSLMCFDPSHFPIQM